MRFTYEWEKKVKVLVAQPCLILCSLIDHLTCLLRNLYAGQEATVRIGHRTTGWIQIEKEYLKAVYCHPAYLTYMQSTS